ncbi:MAG: cytochrome c-type biogenesis protein CcmH [Rhizobiales bacterium]|nr:cytochrome c-type biogenesis protein CcmH [Hyphomicrobiales bacterium]
MRTLFALFLFLATALPAFAVNPDEVLSDPALEQRAREISAKLRCLVCQNQSIDDSDATLARDLRVLVRERLVAGDSNAAAVDYIVARYGEFVLLQPRLAAHTLVLWLTPVLALAFGIGYLALRRRRAVGASPGKLTGEEEAALAALLERRD